MTGNFTAVRVNSCLSVTSDTTLLDKMASRSKAVWRLAMSVWIHK